ncbi:hypothetical protein [Comamonas composti]|uniref:hypothetical protein n=1 Tax=Comamonas composti TaxID=408558 RepID=UPI00040C3394|nr:hypothetical protein [Comamonas composti]
MSNLRPEFQILPLFAQRTPCPAGACICEHQQLLDSGHGDQRILRLTREEEKQLLARLERAQTLDELRRFQQRMAEQLGIQLRISAGHHEVRSARGLTIELEPQPGLCRKTRRNIPAAIRRAMEAHPEIIHALLNENSLFAGT